MTVKEKLREVMDWRGFTNKKLAELTNIPPSTISAYVSGRNAMSVEVIYQLAPALGVTPWTLLNCEPLLATPDDLSAEEARILTDLRGLTLDQRELLFKVMETMKKQNQK